LDYQGKENQMATPQAISKIIKNAGFKMSQVRNGRVASYRHEGVFVEKDYLGRVTVRVAQKESWNDGQRSESKAVRLATQSSVAELLKSKGYTLADSDVYEGGVVVVA
jgi:hypothetical protein